jgi:hypothetical protein
MRSVLGERFGNNGGNAGVFAYKAMASLLLEGFAGF